MFKYTVILVVICKPCYSANTKLAQIQSLLSRSSLRNMVHLKDTIFRLTVYIFKIAIVYFKNSIKSNDLTLIPQFSSSSYPVANYSNYSFFSFCVFPLILNCLHYFLHW